MGIRDRPKNNLIKTLLFRFERYRTPSWLHYSSS